MTVSTPVLPLLDTEPTVSVRRRVQPRPAVDIDRMTRYHGGTYSHTVDRIVFTDGTSARTDLIRLNPGIAAYSLDFHGIAPTRPSQYRIDTWSAVPNLRADARDPREVQVDWILRNSVPRLTTVELSRRLREAGHRLGRGNITEHEAIAATQAAIWRLTNGLELDTRARTEPVRVLRDADGVTVEFEEALELGGYTVELLAAGPVTVTLHKSDDGRAWREVKSSRLAVETTGSHRKALGVGATVGGHRFYRLAVAGSATSATLGDVDFGLHGTSTYRNADRIVALYGYLLAGAARARTTAPGLNTSDAVLADGLVGPLRLSVADSAELSAEGAVLLDADGNELTGPVEPGSVFYLRPRPGAVSARVRVTVPGTEDGYGGRVLTGIAGDQESPMFTPVALAVPAALVVDFDLSWSQRRVLPHRSRRPRSAARSA
ncbi:TQXA domain-containing protein [Mycolicibacter nonchromogenicus]|uniref:TQXA domain-containing protein n=1 Tax=Mycolicibacter nonchromogenicus TaxID=1782 RepID=UPI000A149564|nr:TQXA domain-containing protein [Mycolicibacter nonchromogenicus]